MRRPKLRQDIEQLRDLGWLDADDADWLVGCRYGWVPAQVLADLAVRIAGRCAELQTDDERRQLVAEHWQPGMDS